MLDKTSSIICAFGLAAAAPRSPYRHLELCGIVLSRNTLKHSLSLSNPINPAFLWPFLAVFPVSIHFISPPGPRLFFSLPNLLLL
jgi:hypothetical protein